MDFNKLENLAPYKSTVTYQIFAAGLFKLKGNKGAEVRITKMWTTSTDCCYFNCHPWTTYDKLNGMENYNYND